MVNNPLTRPYIFLGNFERWPWGVGTLIMGILAAPPKATPPKNKALLRDYENPLVSLNKAGY